MPDAAERALVSIATAYRYFPSADDLWWEASNEAFGLEAKLTNLDQQIDAAGDDPQARLEVLLRTVGFRMLDDQMPFRQLSKRALELWFQQLDTPEGERVPVRQERRNEQVRMALAPLVGQLPEKQFDRIVHALGLVAGSEAMISLIDAVGLDVPEAKETLVDAGRWVLAGALAELTDPRT